MDAPNRATIDETKRRPVNRLPLKFRQRLQIELNWVIPRLNGAISELKTLVTPNAPIVGK